MFKLSKFTVVVTIIILTTQASLVHGQNLQKNNPFEDLSSIVTSVSKRPEKSQQAPAAIYVITQDDIKYSGLTSIPEVLRMVPGLDVARSDSKSWAITARGFNDGFGNKLLVLIDGRSIYTPLFSGVYWEIQDTFIDDIERIEVIRGPGATLWGANAVNGVINIITKKAKDTQKTLANFAVGKEDELIAEGRYGGKIGENIFYRNYVKRFNHDSSRNINGGNGGNSWYSERTGFRTDWEKSPVENVTFLGDIYYGNEKLNLASLPSGGIKDELNHAGGNLVAKWTKKHDESSESNLQTYFDRTHFDYISLQQDINTFDLDYQYSKQYINHQIILGAGYRLINDKLQGTDILNYNPESATHDLLSAFIQDSYYIIPKKLNVTLGSKLEHNDYTGFEIQPNIRIALTPNERNTYWASISRAVRTPNRSEDSISLEVIDGVRWVKNKNFKSEELTAYEIGYKFKPRENLTFDVASFYNDYNKLRTTEFIGTVGSDTILQFDNKAKGETYGIELASEFNIQRFWKINASYSFLNVNIHKKDSSDILVENDEGTSAKNKFNIRSAVFLPKNVEASASLYYVDEIASYNIDPYFRLDSRIAWHPTTNLELSLVGTNLLDKSHQEFAPPLHGQANEIERGYYFKLSLLF